MKTRTIAKCLVTLCGVLLAHSAFAQSQDALSTAQTLVVRCGLAVQLRGVVHQVISHLEQQRGKVPQQIMPGLADAAREAYRPEILQHDVASDIARRLKVEEMKAAIAWLESDIGRRVTLAEEASSTQSDDAADQKFREWMREQKSSSNRLALVKSLIAASYAEESGVQGLQAVALGVALGMDSTQPAEKRLGLARIRERVEAAMPQARIRNELRATLPGAYLYTYRDISDRDLEAYLTFLRSPSGKRYSEQVNTAFMHVLARASLRLGQLVEQNSTRRQI